MHGKKRICRTILITCLVFFMSGSCVSAEEIPGDLPVIARWEEGCGFDSAGMQITGGWAYDSVNEAGKYVLFDENGMVQRKAERWEGREDAGEYFTPTEQETGTIALRSEVFEGFAGEISVTVEEENGTAKKYVLSPANLYEFNIPAHSGRYRILRAEAADDTHVYLAEYSREPFCMEENGLFLCSIQVTDQQAGEVQQKQQETPVEAEGRLEEENTGERRQAVSGRETDYHKGSIGERNGSIRSLDLKYLFLGAGIVVILAVGLWVRSRKKKYQ